MLAGVDVEAPSARAQTEGLRPPIAASWTKCRALGLRPHHLQLPRADARGSAHPLLRASGALFDGICQELHDSGVAVVVTDEDATVLALRCSGEAFRRTLLDVQLVPGYIWKLETAGTNAIGIATQHREPAMVNGPEHFMQPLKALTTVSAPISDERTGQLRGTFSLVCRAEAANPLLLPVARHGAREIGEALVDHSSAHERMLTEAFLRARRRERGPLVVVGEGLMLRNAAGARLFSEAQGASLWKTVARAETSDPAPVEFVSRRGAPVLGRVEPIRAADVLVGALLRFARARGREPHHQRRMFGWDSLTETELALAELVASGLTNREVAARLFLSHHTVDTHLRHIFRKLDINSRVELARLLTTTTSTSRGDDDLHR